MSKNGDLKPDLSGGDKETLTKDKVPDISGRHSLWTIYVSTFRLALIFLLDILPSRVSLMIVGNLTSDYYAFNSIFLSYSFTNFFSVFILSLSCGLDTLSKEQLRNIIYLRYSLLLVCLSFIPYIICCIYSNNILYFINQPSLIIESTQYCIKLLIPHAISYIIFAMLRKSLLQYLHTSLLIGFMLARLCLHLILGYVFFYYSDLGFYGFVLSDSISMIVLLLITIMNLARWISFGKFLMDLVSPSKRQTLVYGSSIEDIQSQNPNISSNYFKKYVSATFIPGGISCLEWWAVETFTFLIGGTRYINGDILTVFLVHGIWSSFLLLFQMPMLGLSVSMAAIMTYDIRSKQYNRAKYTLIQALGSVVFYCAIVSIIVIFCYEKFIYLFFGFNKMDAFKNDVINYSNEITTFFILSLFGYSIAMSFLGMFVSVGRLAMGGTFMLIGYYPVGLILSIILGYILNWKLYGIWFGYSCGYIIWCILSIGYWSCVDWKKEMIAMKEEYDKHDKQFNNKNSYGSINDDNNTPLNFDYNKYITKSNDIDIDNEASDIINDNNNDDDDDNENEIKQNNETQRLISTTYQNQN